MITNNTCVNKILKNLKSNGCKRVTVLNVQDIIFEFNETVKTIKDIIVINFLNKNDIQISFYIHLNDLENIYLIKNNNDKKYYRVAHVINNQKQINDIYKKYFNDKKLDAFKITEINFDVDAYNFLSVQERKYPEIKFFYLEVLIYDNLEPWIIKHGTNLVIDSEKRIIENLLPYVINLEF